MGSSHIFIPLLVSKDFDILPRKKWVSASSRQYLGSRCFRVRPRYFLKEFLGGDTKLFRSGMSKSLLTDKAYTSAPDIYQWILEGVLLPMEPEKVSENCARKKKKKHTEKGC